MTEQELETVFERPIAFHRIFFTITRSISAALLLSQMWYWKDRTRDPDGWFYKTHREWEQETGLSRHKQDAARERLRELGLISERYKGMRRALHFRVNGLELLEKVNEAINKKSQAA